jgi:hypothetical protein
VAAGPVLNSRLKFLEVMLKVMLQHDGKQFNSSDSRQRDNSKISTPMQEQQ